MLTARELRVAWHRLSEHILAQQPAEHCSHDSTGAEAQGESSKLNAARNSRAAVGSVRAG